ncbi:MAG: ABC transporter permease [Euryarchaeota archaeon]|nr:ABC transporter permease [Euryarchaeota archaeon]
MRTIYICCGGFYLHNILSIAKKDLNGLFNERTLVLTILIQLFIASFSSFLVLGLTSFYDPGALQEDEIASVNIGLAYRSEILLNNSTDTGTDTGTNISADTIINTSADINTTTGINASADTRTRILREDRSVNETLLYHLIDKSKLSPVCYPDYSSAGSSFYEGKIDGILLVPNNAVNKSDLIEIHIYLPETDLKATILMLQLKEPLERFEQYVRDIRTKRLLDYVPIKLNIPKKSSNHYFEFIYVALLPLLVFTPAFISGGLIVDFITEEFEQKTIDLLLVSPLTVSDILNGKILVATMIVPVQVSAWLLLLSINGIYIHNILAIVLFVTAITLILVLTGALISIILKNRGLAQLFYSLVLIMLFLLCYTFPNSPMNIVTRLSIGSMNGIDNALCTGIYLLIAACFYAVFHHIARLMQYRSMYRSGYHR